ncbi:inosine/xanthosine triphosphatase [Natronobacterium gregoryi]|uniref:Probable inosine/xanthosine triphosphatase n=2 Tax=Natronobacterium gregoryi TaxID=44930 RepID=L0AGI5_NATGS|nr:inosine/xanthosine triphosphatase [Natronobacterium gregoryi]AFZ72267.1 inosine/xanthosine triphosphatase [Natronobacterium gregoryi SP2]ELY62333.1 hypothetical protein C490_18288 [Natronobacterium gregoryi SP2]PLK20215.1 inosine/xanthosine triphosphatase [Natronobacterium gregoryi SP2]SFJ29220.1 inosine/xanthosine triphosphatase [Natronobacterium gregoryi]
MQVAVGTENPVKVEAVERTLERFDPSVEAVAVDSGVAEQPWSVAKTVAGAENRARRALEATDATYGVGLEGGVARFEGVPGLFLIMWCVVTDGDRVERGGGPALRLPDDVVDRLEEGAELGPVMDELLGTDGIAKAEGAAGALTDALTDRRQALGEAVASASGPFLSNHYD